MYLYNIQMFYNKQFLVLQVHQHSFFLLQGKFWFCSDASKMTKEECKYVHPNPYSPNRTLENYMNAVGRIEVQQSLILIRDHLPISPYCTAHNWL